MNEGGLRLCDRLCDEASDGEAEQIDLAQAEGVDECDRILPHLRHRRWRCATRPGDALVVEDDDVVTFGDPVDDRGVPIVHRSAEMLQEDDGDSVLGTEFAIDEGRPAHIDRLCRRRLGRDAFGRDGAPGGQADRTSQSKQRALEFHDSSPSMMIVILDGVRRPVSSSKRRMSRLTDERSATT